MKSFDNHEVFDDFKEAQLAQILRRQISEYATAAVQHGIDRDWVNTRLHHLGAASVTGPARYQINVPVTGNYGTTVTANSRAEALTKFNLYAQQAASRGHVGPGSYHCEGVYGVEFFGAEPVFHSGPKDLDLSDVKDIDLAALREGIRQMIKLAVGGQGWSHGHAVVQLEEMGLEPLPALTTQSVRVPVNGTAQLEVSVFDGASDEEVQATITAAVARYKNLVVTPEEVGAPLLLRSGGMSMELVDDVEDDDHGALDD